MEDCSKMRIIFLFFFVFFSFCMFKRRSTTRKAEFKHNINDTSSVSVFEFGASGDCKTDDTHAFQSALKFVSNLGGGIVIAPSPHCYAIKGVLNIPERTTLKGSYSAVPSHVLVWKREDPTKGGTCLTAFSGKGDANGTPFITLGINSAVVGFVIYYPEQVFTSPPVEYPWTIAVNGAENAAIIDVELLNSYQGILLQGAGRHYVARVQGQPLFKGIYLDAIYDIGRIEDVHWNPWWSGTDKDVFKWQLANGVAFEFGRSDWEYVFNTFAFGYKIGYHFIETKNGACNGNFLGIGADLMTESSVFVEQTQPMGILITNGEFTAFQGSDSTEIRVGPQNVGSVRLNNCNFWGPAKQIAILEGSGTVSFNSCVFVQWDKDQYAVYAHNEKLQIQDSKQIYLYSTVEKAIVVGNVFKGKELIHNDAKMAKIDLNL